MDKPIIVQKFGGTSLQTPDQIKNIAKRILYYKNLGYHVVSVVSAMGKTTNELTLLAKQVSSNPSKRELDVLLSTGEQISIALLSMALSELDVKSISLTGSQCGITTDQVFNNARIEDINPKRILEELGRDKIAIVAGFQGVTKLGDITTLGRGGSDTTAVALSASLNAEKCQIYTDVDGIFSADPNKIKNAKKIDSITYDEMLEMAKLGAQVLHPRSVELAKKYNVILEVKNSLNYNEGTKIVKGVTMEKINIRGITSEDSIARISLARVPDQPGIAYKLFKSLAENLVPIDMILQNLSHENYNDISFTTFIDSLEDTLPIVNEFAKSVNATEVIVKKDVSKISLIGTGILGHGEIVAKFFETLSNLGINIEMISTSEIKISCIINSEFSDIAIKELHSVFFE